METLEGRFQEALNVVVRAARHRGGKQVSRLLALIREHGGVAAVRRVLAEPASADAESGRYVDKLVLVPESGCLFAEAETRLPETNCCERGHLAMSTAVHDRSTQQSARPSRPVPPMLQCR
jgi:hypothetical protein